MTGMAERSSRRAFNWWRVELHSNTTSGHELREAQASYCDHFGCDKGHLSHENALPWHIYDEISM
jgi:hypothetical protein